MAASTLMDVTPKYKVHTNVISRDWLRALPKYTSSSLNFPKVLRALPGIIVSLTLVIVHRFLTFSRSFPS